MHLDPFGDYRLFSAFCGCRTNHSRDNHRCRHHVGIDRGQCVLRSQGRSHIFDIDSRAEVLKVGSGGDSKNASDIEHGRAGLLAVLWGSIVAAVFAIIVATQIFASDVAQTFRIGRKGSVSGFDFSLSFLLLAIGHLVGLSVGIAMLIGAVIGWGWAVLHYSALAQDVT